MADRGPPCLPGANDPVFKKQFEFRRMLGQVICMPFRSLIFTILPPSSIFQVSSELGQDNLRQLKNLCSDIIPLQQREAMDNGVQVFDMLIQKRT